MLGVVVPLAACDLEYTTDEGAGGGVGGNGGNGGDQVVVDSPIVGEWHTSSVMGDYMYDAQSLSSYGGGGTGEGYCFRANGTYTYYIVSTGYGPGSLAGWLIEDGRYRVEGNQVVLYDRYSSYTNTKNPSASRPKEKADGDTVYAFEVVSNDELNVQNVLSAEGGPVTYDTFQRSYANSDFAALRG